MTNKPKVLMIHRIFASYRKPIYDKLAEEYDFLLLHGLKDKTINQASTSYSRPIKSIQYTKNPTNLIFESFSHFFKFMPKVVIHEFAIGMLTLIPMYICSKLMGAKFVLYSHGYNRLTGFNPQKSWADKYRVILMKLADATVIYTQTDKKKLGAYSDRQKIFIAQNTLDATHLIALRKGIEKEGKESIKQRLGFAYKYNLTFIGRLLDEKLPEKVLEVFDFINKKMPNQVGVHFVGGGETAHLQATVKGNNWQNQVKFYGAVYDDQRTGEFLFASDLMVIPGSLGLAINHAFIFDCPVVSFERNENGPYHGPEIEYVLANETGFLIPNHSVEKMADKIIEYLQNELLQAEMKSTIRHKMETELTTDNMVKGFTDAVYFALYGKNFFAKTQTSSEILRG